MSKENHNPLGFKPKDFELKDGVITPKEGQKLFEKHLPEGISVKDVRALDEYKEEYTGSVIAVTGEMAIDHLKKNKDVDRVITKCRIINGEIKTVFNREDKSRNPKTGKAIIKHGRGRVSITTNLGKRKSIANAREHIGAMAEKAFG